jgi:PKD repeat protein
MLAGTFGCGDDEPAEAGAGGKGAAGGSAGGSAGRSGSAGKGSGGTGNKSGAGEAGTDGTATGGSGGSGNRGGSASTGEGTELRAKVTDVFGRKLEGVRLSVVDSDESARTNDAGEATLSVASGELHTVKVSAEGYTEQFKVLAPNAGTKIIHFEAELLAREAPRTITAVETGGAAAGKHGVRLELPPNAVVDESGDVVTGPIEVSMTPVNVLTVELGAFPGRFLGIDEDGDSNPIVSYGTVEFLLTRDGEPVRLADDAEATVELPLYPTRHPDGVDIALGDSIPLWSLDEQTGIWKQEGAGTVVESLRSPSGLALRATVTHFSWWNGDGVPEKATVKVRCVDDDTFEVDGETQCVLVGGAREGDLPRGGFDPTSADAIVNEFSENLLIPANVDVFISGCAMVLRVSDGALAEACAAGTVNLETGAEGTLTLPLRLGEAFEVKLLEPARDLTTDGDVEFEVDVTGEATIVELIADNEFDADAEPTVIKTWTAPPYRFTWDTLEVKQGIYLVGAVAHVGSRTVSADRTVTVTVERDLPPPDAAFSVSLALDRPLFSVVFDASDSQTNGPPLETFFWDFGDGDQLLSDSSGLVSHRYTTPGTYAVTLTVTDGDGEQDSVTENVVIAERESLGPITLERAGAELDERQDVTFRASLPAAMNVTWSARYSDTHPITALRGRCLTLQSECAEVVPDGGIFEFTYRPDSPFNRKAARPEAAFEAYDDLITITAATPTGLSVVTETIEVPPLKEFELGTDVSVPCFASADTMRRIDPPDAWFAFAITAADDVDFYADISQADSEFPVTWPEVEYFPGEPRLTHPMRGRGERSVVAFRCFSDAPEISLDVQAVTPSGTLTVGELTEATPSERGDFYLVEGVPTDPPLADRVATQVTVAARRSTSLGAEVDLFASDGAQGLDDGCSLCDFNAASLRLFPPIELEFAVVVRHLDFPSTELLIDVPAPQVTVDLGETVATRLAIGIVPTEVVLTAPSDEWVLVTNDQGTRIDRAGGGWPFASPLFEDEWRAGVATDEPQEVSLSLPISAQFFFADGLNLTVRTTASRAVITPGVATADTLTAFTHDFIHLYEFEGTSGQQLSLSPAVTDVRYFVFSPTGATLLQCDADVCATSAPASLTTSGRHAVAVRTGLDVTSTVNYDFSFALAP